MVHAMYYDYLQFQLIIPSLLITVKVYLLVIEENSPKTTSIAY